MRIKPIYISITIGLIRKFIFGRNLYIFVREKGVNGTFTPSFKGINVSFSLQITQKNPCFSVESIRCEVKKLLFFKMKLFNIADKNDI